MPETVASRIKISVGFLLVILVVLAVWTSAQPKSRPTERTFTLPAGSVCVNTAFPDGCIFGVYRVQYIISSQYAYEASILPSHKPVADIDYMTPNRQWSVHLPGGRWHTIYFMGAVRVPGSGMVAQFCLAAGGCFDYLHLAYVSISGHIYASSAVTRTVVPPNFKDRGLSGDERTAIIASRMLSRLPRANRIVLHGGDYVGLSRWPDDGAFGNGSFGPVDAHLCVLTDSQALAYFWRVALGRDKPPFPASKWGPTLYKDKFGHLLWPAAWTFRHHETSIYPHYRGDRWLGPAPGRQYGYDEYHFHGSSLGKVLRCWPHYKICKLSKT